MSGFYPVLGLLAVAVCISFDAGTASPFTLRNEYSASKFRELNSDRLQLAGRRDILQESTLNKNLKIASLSEDDDQHNGDISGRKAAYNNQANDFDEVTNQRTDGQNALRRQEFARDGTSVSINDESTRNDELLRSGESTQYQENASRSSEDSNEMSAEGPSDNDSSGTAVSAPEDSCEGDNEIVQTTNDTSGATTSSTPNTPTKQNGDSNTDPATTPDTTEKGSQEECEETELPSKGSGSGPTNESPENEVPESEECKDSGESTNQSQQTEEPGSEQSQASEAPVSEECGETEQPNSKRTSTTSKKPRKKPTHSHESWDTVSGSEESGQRSSGSSSDENTGESIDASWRK